MQTMGKGFTFIVSLAALACLGLLFATSRGNIPREAGLLFGFLMLASAAWVMAALTAAYGLLRHGRGWRWLVALVTLVWLPVLPALCYSVSGFATRRREPRRPMREPVAVTTSINPNEVLLSWPLREEATA